MVRHNQTLKDFLINKFTYTFSLSGYNQFETQKDCTDALESTARLLDECYPPAST